MSNKFFMKKIAHLKSFKTKNLDNNKIKQICKLKMQHYNFSLDKQKKWFKEIVEQLDGSKYLDSEVWYKHWIDYHENN